MDAVDSKPIAVRDLTEADLPILMDYWFRSPAGFIESLGVDTNKLSSEPEFVKSLTERIRANAGKFPSQLNALAITYAGRTIGQHSVNEIQPGESAIFHAHIFDPSMRRRQVGMTSYPLACQFFMNRFCLKRIWFKTPIQNTGSIRVKQKLGIREVDEEIINFGVVKEGTRARVFELLPGELEFLLRKIEC